MTPETSGRCFCNGVQFKLAKKPSLFVACYCRDCQYVSGGGPANVLVVPTEDLDIHTGRELLGSYKCIADSGRAVTRQFCKVCGTPMFEILELDLGMRLVKAGTLDDQSNLKISAVVWTTSTQPWVKTEADGERFTHDPSMAFIEKTMRSTETLALGNIL
jgi:hypothetical protein